MAVAMAVLPLLTGCSGNGSKQRQEATDRPSVRVTRVIDGDTVVATRLGKTRLIGINTPEEGRCYETAATRFTRNRLEGRRVGYELGVEREDRYGRTLAYLYRGGMHNLALVEEGYAKALTIPPNDKYAARFIEAEQRAEQSQEGIFSGECQRRRRARAEARARARARAEAEEAEENQRRRAARRARARREASEGDRSDRSRDGGVPPPPPDLDCSDISGSVSVGPSDPHRLDADGDGVGCE